MKAKPLVTTNPKSTGAASPKGDERRFALRRDAYRSDRIATAAIRTPEGEVFTVPRPGCHHTVIRVMVEAGVSPKNPCVQGFMTDAGGFVDRQEAARIAIRAGQIEKTNWGDELFSEDLW